MDPAYWVLSLPFAVWMMIPAYVPNPAAAFFGGGTPVDLGISLRDGRRLFGDGKTYRGLAAGVIAGILAGAVEIWLRERYGWYMFPEQTLLSVTLLATGALLGDLAKSFFKRRFGRDRGEAWFLADQYDLVIGALLLVLIFNPQWLFVNITLPVAVWIVVLTPLLHRAVNIIGYILRVKDVPW